MSCRLCHGGSAYVSIAVRSCAITFAGGDDMRGLLIGLITALLVAAVSVGTAVSQTPTLTKVPDNQWCAGKYDPTRGSNFAPCVGGK